ncbi:hypothetical protein BKA66DRAFT_477333 [Pyrenochaeta sp. MPI-SDFR-AT-0127]|nr:hypothetical protein BKA66DRAFT_477333 [Pyrenochaeta sp. MPI-SDFR-AT-0127]
MDGHALLSFFGTENDTLRLDDCDFEPASIHDSEIVGWLKTPGTRPTSCLRLITGVCREGKKKSFLYEGETYRRIPFTEETFRQISKVMDLPNDFFQALREGTSYSSRSVNSSDQNSQRTLRFVFKVGLHATGHHTIAITYKPSTKETVALVLEQTGLPDPSRLTELVKTNRYLWNQPMLVPAMTAKALSQLNREKIVEMHIMLNSIQQELPLHGSETLLWSDPSNINFNKLVTKIAYANTTLGVCIMRLHGLLLLLDVVRNNVEIIGKEDGQSLREEQSKLLELAENLGNYCSNLILKAEFDQKRATTYLDVLSTYMAQQVAVWNMTIAVASKRDSSAAASIALLTMLFLPATCIATLFAMPIFNWDAAQNESVFKPRFHIYWKVAIPLTACVLILWGIWTGWRIYQSKQDLNRDLVKIKPEAEAG